MNTQRVEGHTPIANCPFCGSPAEKGEVNTNDEMGEYTPSIECTGCMARMLDDERADQTYGRRRKWDYSDLIEAWNRRASIERLEKVNEALVRALEDAHAHLEYCNYGDSWERECAVEEKLSEKIEAALSLAKEPA